MDRIKEKDLMYLVKLINQRTGSPLTPYTVTKTECRANIGNYHLDAAYSGFKLARMVNDGGGISDPLGGGFCTKRELYYKLTAFLAGLEARNG